MKNIKYGIFAALSVLMVLAIIGCSDNFSAPKIKDYTPLPGYGYVIVQFKDANSRTILPTTDVKDFKAFKLVFTALNGAAADLYNGPDPTNKTTTITITDDDMITPINLLPGDYSLDVTAYMDTAATLDAATGSIPATTPGPLEIKENQGNVVTVTLRPIITTTPTLEDNGTFAWDITLTETGDFEFTVADMDVTNITTSNPALPTQDLLITSTDSASLPTGYYYVNFELADNFIDPDVDVDDPSYPVALPNTLTWRQILYVYKNMTSEFKYEFTEDHFRKPIFNVTFDFNGYDFDLTTVTSNFTVTVLEGRQVDEFKVDRPDRTSSEQYFIGWTTNPSPSYPANNLSILYDFSTPVMDHLILYAWWEESGTIDPNDPDFWDFEVVYGVGDLEFSVYAEKASVPLATQPTIDKDGKITISRADIDRIIITADDTDFDNFEWWWNGTNLASGLTPFATANELTIDLLLRQWPFNINAKYLILVTATDDNNDDELVSAILELEITP